MTPTPTPAGTAGAVPSPCIGVCRIEPGTGWCAGCWRSLDEIAAWSGADDATRRAIWALLPARRAQAQPAAKAPPQDGTA